MVKTVVEMIRLLQGRVCGIIVLVKYGFAVAILDISHGVMQERISFFHGYYYTTKAVY